MKECTLYERVMIRSALSFWKWEWKSERTHFFSNEWELSKAQKINERWTRCLRSRSMTFSQPFYFFTFLTKSKLFYSLHLSESYGLNEVNWNQRFVTINVISCQYGFNLWGKGAILPLNKQVICCHICGQ